MLFFFSTGVAVGFLVATSHGLVPYDVAKYNSIAPEPTNPPSLELMMARLRRLRKRAGTESSNTIAPWTMARDETCGYLSGDPGVPITCDNSDNTCVWFVKTVSGEVGGAVGCIDSKWMGTLHWDCMESEVAVNTNECNDVCQSNVYTLRCTDSSAPYCRIYAYPSNVYDYECVGTPQSRVSSVSWTWDGENMEDSGFVTTNLDQTSSMLLDITTTGLDSIIVSSTKPATTTESQEPTDPPKSGTPVGAIVGGVVGGVAVLGLILLGAIYLMRRKRRVTNSDSSSPPVPQIQSPVATVESKSLVDSPLPQSSVSSPVLSDRGRSYAVSPMSETTPVAQFHHVELSAHPPGYSDSIHELSANQNNMR